MKQFLFPVVALGISCLISSTADAQTVWSFGFEDADYTAAGGSALSYTFDFDGVNNSRAYVDNAYTSATTDLVYGGDYHVTTGFDAQEGTNFGWLSTSNTCFGFDGDLIGLVDGQNYQLSFYVAGLDPTIEPTTSFSVSPAFHQFDGVSTTAVQGTDEQGAALFASTYGGAPNTFSDPGWAPTATTTNDKDALQWVEYTTSFTYDSSVDKLFVSGFGDDGVGTHLALDNLRIEAVPEPSSAILCVGGAMLWAAFGRRRRRKDSV